MFMWDEKEARKVIDNYYSKHKGDGQYNQLNLLPHSDIFIEDTNRYIFFMCGLPASGKSTAANFIAHELEDNYIVLSRDKFRDYLRDIYNTSDYFPTTANTELKLWTDFIVSFINTTHKDIIIDQTTLNRDTYEKMKAEILNSLPEFMKPKTKIGLIFKMVPLSVCLERNKTRENKPFKFVPEETIEKMEKSFLKMYYWYCEAPRYSICGGNVDETILISDM